MDESVDCRMKKVIVIGGGAAGMMAAISASSQKKDVLLLEKNEKLGKKLYITGKGRCNVTTACPAEEFFDHVVTNPRFLYSSFSRFSNRDMMEFLKKAGLPTKVERGQRVFPASDRSADVLDTLRKKCIQNHVRIYYHTIVSELLLTSDKTKAVGVRLKDGKVLKADTVILATGGVSYPSTGSTGDGYRLAADAGHKIMPAEPSLVPFLMKENWCKDLMGLTLKNVSLSVKNGEKTVYEGFGEMLFTHFGVSGPLVLTASTRLGGLEEPIKKGRLTLHLNLKPALSAEELNKRFLKEFDIYRNKNISTVIERLLPKSMVPVFLREAGIFEKKKVRDITKEERKTMAARLQDLTMHIKGVRGFDEAIVTRGGVCVKEVSPKTMESRLVKNLYFAGEVLDVDGETGGYNLQIAWSTGYTAGYFA